MFSSFLFAFVFEEKCFRFLSEHLILSPFFEHCPFDISPPFIFFNV